MLFISESLDAESFLTVSWSGMTSHSWISGLSHFSGVYRLTEYSCGIETPCGRSSSWSAVNGFFLRDENYGQKRRAKKHYQNAGYQKRFLPLREKFPYVVAQDVKINHSWLCSVALSAALEASLGALLLALSAVLSRRGGRGGITIPSSGGTSSSTKSSSLST